MKETQRPSFLEQLDRIPVAKLTSDLRKKIDKIYQEFSQRVGFPIGYCSITPELLSVLGFQAVFGNFRVDGSLKEFSHNWNIDANGQIIDLTAT